MYILTMDFNISYIERVSTGLPASPRFFLHPYYPIFFMTPLIRGQRHYVFGLSIRPSGFFVYAKTLVLLDEISPNLAQG